jgi:hypothetical protein
MITLASTCSGLSPAALSFLLISVLARWRAVSTISGLILLTMIVPIQVSGSGYCITTQIGLIADLASGYHVNGRCWSVSVIGGLARFDDAHRHHH